MTTNDEYFLRRAIALADEARQRGADPFGAVLVKDGVILHESSDRSVESSDPTFHAELSVISEYCRREMVMSLAGCTLYASTEPCPMCAGAIHWSRISRLVFSVSQQMLNASSGGRPKPSAASLLAEYKQVEIVGPLIPDEGWKTFEGYTFTSKIARHAAKFGKG
jgi:tRNA(Arg) A34 adenosine deaminase TadA